MKLLERMGYPRAQLIFQSNTSEKSSSSVVDSVEFRDDHRVVVTLNLGLLGAEGLLPTYFIQRASQLDALDELYAFARYFDHGLIGSMVRSLDPEGPRGAYRDIEEMKRSYLRLIGLSSASGMQWLLQRCFPETVVRVQRSLLERIDTGFAAQPGGQLDGVGVIGGSYASAAAGLVADLIVEDEVDDRGRPWLSSFEPRLTEKVLPIIAPEATPLEIRLLVLDYRRFAAVADLPEAHPARLGRERVKGREGTPYTIPLYTTFGA